MNGEEFTLQKFREQLELEHGAYEPRFSISFAVKTALRHPHLENADPDLVRSQLQTALRLKSREFHEYNPRAEYIRLGGSPINYQIAYGPQGAPRPNNKALVPPATPNYAPQPLSVANREITRATSSNATANSDTATNQAGGNANNSGSDNGMNIYSNGTIYMYFPRQSK